MIGKTLGHYEILEKIGSGGMGEVFRARDTKLGRDVAVKVLPASMSENTDRLGRFEKEARAAGGLNHPNLVTIYELGTHEGLPYIVMELIEGETLREKLGSSPASSIGQSSSGGQEPADTDISSPSGTILPIRKTLDYAIQMGQGLAAAHDKGIIHRDLKPENVFVTRKGQVKILDFGLAKLAAPPEEHLTIARTALDDTEPGTVLGTVGYMSPEQVRGEEVDHRSDIFSLGVILYEMLSGGRTFQADSSVQIMNAILTEDPASLSGEDSRVSLAVDRIVRRCLEKQKEERFQSGSDLAYAMEAVQDTSAAMPAARAVGIKPVWIRPAILVGAGVVIAATAFLAGKSSGPATAPAATAMNQVRLSPLTFEQGREFQPSLSPDGRSFVYVARDDGDWDIFFRRVGGETAINLTADSPEDDFQPAFSPDGEQIAFRSDHLGGGIYVMGATGESMRRVTDFGYNPAWSPDGKELAICEEGIEHPLGRRLHSDLWRVDIATGDTTLVTRGDAVEPHWSPDGTRLAYWGLPEGTGKRTLYTISVNGGTPVSLTDDHYFNWNPTWSNNGSHLYFTSNRGGTMDLWRLAIDQNTGKRSGEPEPITVSSNWSAGFSPSMNGRRILYMSSHETKNISRLAFDPQTKQVVGQSEVLFRTTRNIWEIHPSPDGKGFSLAAADPDEDLYVSALDGTGMRRLTNDRFKDREPVWGPDPNRIFFFSDRTGRYEIWSIQRDGSGLQQITELTGGNVFSQRPSPDGKFLSVISNDREGSTGIIDLSQPLPTDRIEWLPPIGSDRLFFATIWSPDGKRLAGVAGGSLVLYTLATKEYEEIPEAKPDGRAWLTDGRTILYRDDSKIMTVDVETKEIRVAFEIPESLDLDTRWQLSNDNRWVYFIQNNLESDIWMLEFEKDGEGEGS